MRQLLTFGGNQPLIDALVGNRVRFLVMGGSAARFHFPEWPTDDLDLLVEPTVPNGERIIGALRSLGCKPKGWTSERLAKPHAQIVLKEETSSHFHADILTPTRAFDFLAHWPLAVDAWVGVTPVKVAAAETVALLMEQSPEPRHHDSARTLRQLMVKTHASHKD